MSSTIGVVVATYNGERYLETQLSSILQQTVKPDLIVVSDGGSTDDTLLIAHEVLSLSNIPHKVLSSDERLSVAANFEKALRECDTDYIFFADQDDKWIDTKIEHTIKYIEDDCVLLFTNAFVTDEKLQHHDETLWQQIGYKPQNTIERYYKGNETFVAELIRHNVVTGMCMCITRELKSIAIPFPGNVIHDYWLALLGICIGTVISINEPLTLYRQHKNNVVGTSTSIRKSYGKRLQYLDGLRARASMIEKLINIIENAQKASVCTVLNEYKSYLNRRIEYLSDNRIFGNTIPISEYSKFEYKKERVICRDIFTKFSKIIK